MENQSNMKPDFPAATIFSVLVIPLLPSGFHITGIFINDNSQSFWDEHDLSKQAIRLSIKLESFLNRMLIMTQQNFSRFSER